MPRQELQVRGQLVEISYISFHPSCQVWQQAHLPVDHPASPYHYVNYFSVQCSLALIDLSALNDFL